MHDVLYPKTTKKFPSKAQKKRDKSKDGVTDDLHKQLAYFKAKYESER